MKKNNYIYKFNSSVFYCVVRSGYDMLLNKVSYLKNNIRYTSSMLPISSPVKNLEGKPYSVEFIEWFSGLVDGEGCFYVNTKKANTSTGYQIIMTFSLSQHIRDEELLTKIKDYLGCGNIEKVSTRPTYATIVVYKYANIKDIIIPFFSKYPLQGVKSLDFQDFCKISNIMVTKEHLTLQGVKKIKSLKSQKIAREI